MTLRAAIKCKGHAAARLSDAAALEILLAQEWANRPAAIGYAAEFDPHAIARLRGRVAVTIACAGETDRFEATLSAYGPSPSAIVFGRDPAIRARVFAFDTSKSAADLAPALKDKLRGPNAEVEVVIEALGEALSDSAALFLVGMPIGNNADLSSRALSVLSSVDVIFAEDTRLAADALVWRGVRAPMRSCHSHNEAARAEELVERLNAGERVAFVSDAGMPLVSDPGFRLVEAALATDALVTVVPGPSAALAALAISGLPSDRFRFLGFPPRKAGERAAFIASALADPDTTIMMEAASRIEKLIDEIVEAAPERRIALSRDLTKSTERTYRATAADVRDELARDGARGEYTLVLAGAPEQREPSLSADSTRELIAALVAEGCPTAPIAKALRRLNLMSRSEAYALVESMRGARSGGSDDENRE